MGTVSARLPDELEDELEAYSEAENVDRSTAVRQLLAEGLADWRQQRALEKLAAGKVSFTRAAEIAGVSVWDFARMVEDNDVTWISDDYAGNDLDQL